MLLVDATTGEHARGIGTVIRGVVVVSNRGIRRALVAAGPTWTYRHEPPRQRVPIARTRPGRLVYQRLLLPYDAARLEAQGDRIDRILLLDAYMPFVLGRNSIRYGALVHDTLALSHPQYWPRAKRLVKSSAFWLLRRSDATLFTSTEFNARELRRLTGRDSRVVRFGCGHVHRRGGRPGS